MKFASMRFGGFTFKRNPLSLSVISSKRLLQTQFPQKGETQKITALSPKIIRGEGEFTGEDCLEQYQALESVFLRGEASVLTLPNCETYYVNFTKLEARAGTTPNILRYSFEFSEVSSLPANLYPNSEYVCQEGDNLFDISYREGVAVETLVGLNPQIPNIRALKEGERVRLC